MLDVEYKEKFFVNLSDIDPSIQIKVRYNSNDNFIGSVITGYENANKIWLTKKAALLLAEIQILMLAKGYSLLVYDGYRPQKAVNHFIDWAKTSDDIMKDHYYPHIDKKDIFPHGYIAAKSTHSRGSTIDLTLIDSSKKVSNQLVVTKRTLSDGKIISYLDDNSLDMGSSFDLFDEVSFPNNKDISKDAQNNRNLLREIMEKFGFIVSPKEWWHYTLQDEPIKDKYLDFDI